MYRGSLQEFYLKKVTHESLDVAFMYLNVERIKMRQYFTNILKYDISSDDMKKKIDHWLDSFETFHQEYIIMPAEPYNPSFFCRYITFRSLPGFVNQKIKQEVILMQSFNCYTEMLFNTIDTKH